MSAPVRIGVSGWSYPDWKGVVYPRSCRDTLRFVAELVDFVEINVTFYRTPRAAMVESWVQRTADLGTSFTAKLPQRATHEGIVDPVDATAFRAALQPLTDSGRLSALLAQFSFRLEAGDGAFRHLGAIAQAFGGMAPLLLEVRHASWRAPAAQARATGLGFRLIHLDYPGAETGFRAPADELSRSPGLEYLRLHGRNARAWFDKTAGRDATYDWLYGPVEVTEIERRVAAIRALAAASTVLVVANNHFRGQALTLALQLASWARGSKVAVPATMLTHYPQLASIARHAQRRLFDA